MIISEWPGAICEGKYAFPYYGFTMNRTLSAFHDEPEELVL